MNIIIGLGNVGKKYEKTRHNVGFMIVDQLYARWSKFKTKAELKFTEKKKLNALVAITKYQDEKIILVKPTTLMNNSGLAVAAIKKFYKAKTDDIIIIHDDKDLDFKNIKVKQKGSSGGHNGLKSIIEHIGSEDFLRLKIGIEQLNRKSATSNFVLKDFSKVEQEDLSGVLNWSAEAIEAIITNGPDKAANRFN